MLRLPAIASFVLVVLIAISPAAAQRGRSTNLRDGREVRTAFRSIVADASTSTVRILCDNKEAALGAVVGLDGWIVTKFSELREPVVCRLADGRKFPAQVLGHDPTYDLAMLKIEATNLKPVAWADDATGPAVGQLLATVGPGDLPQHIGVVSVPRRAIPTPARLGVQLDDARGGVRIVSIVRGSAAERCGLQPDDVVVRIADKLVESRERMIELIRKSRPGDKVPLQVRRGDAELSLTATLAAADGERPSRADRMNRMGGPLSNVSVGFPQVIQHDTFLRPSDCGGPIVDLDGRAVGINIARAGRTESYAAPADKVLALLGDLQSGRLALKTPLPGSKETEVVVKQVEVTSTDARPSASGEASGKK